MPRGEARSKILPFSTGQATAQPTKYRAGMSVYHSKYGEGTVLESARSGTDEEVTVVFKGVGVKKLLASFANLVILKNR